MKQSFSISLQSDISSTAHSAFQSAGVVNIPLLAEQVRRRNEVENVALEDIEHALLQHGKLLSAAMEFDRTAIAGFAIRPLGA